MVENVIKQVTNVKNGDKSDKFANLVGHFGRWQFIVFASVFLVKVSSGWVQMAILFLTPSLTFRCAEFSATSEFDVNNLTKITENATVQNSTCYDDCVRYEYDTSPFDNTIISEWDLICTRSWLASFTQMILQCGVLIGSIVFGFLSDRFGRKNTFLLAVTILTIFGLAVPFAPNYTIFTILRFFLGFGVAGTMVVSFVIVMETIGPKYRELLGCTFQIPFILGHMSIPLFAYYFRSWDTYCLALGVPQLLYIGYFFILNESPRWLLSVGRVDEATKIIKKIAAMNKLPTEKIEESISKLSQDLKSTTNKPKTNYSDLLHHSLRVRFVCCCVIWFIMGGVFYGFNQYLSQTSPDPFISVAAAGAIQIPANLSLVWLLRQFGRKKTLIGLFLSSGICILALGYVPQLFWLTLTLSTFGVSFSAGVAAAVYVYTSEMFPTVVRNMAMGACSTTMRIGSMIAPFIANLSMTIPWLPTIIFGVASLSAVGFIIVLPETKGKVMPDTIEDVTAGD